MTMSRRQAQANHMPIDWERWKQLVNEDANRQQSEQMLQNATREDLVALVTFLEAELKQAKAEAENATFAARINADTIKELRRRG